MTKSTTALIAAGVALVGLGVAGSTRIPGGQSATPAAADIAFRNVRVFDGERVIPDTTVLVRNGRIASVGETAPDRTEVIDGSGRTLLPGLIDAHTHAFGDALERALLFGVTTELDMFTDHRFAAAMRAAQQQAGGAPGRADLFSAGTLVTVPKGHGTEYGLAIPTLGSASEAAAFVDARLAEGSDYVKIVYDNGRTYGLQLASLDPEMLRAAIAATRARGKLALVHPGSRRDAVEAIEAGASGLVHVFADAPPEPGWADGVRRAGAFVTPTLSVIESTTGVPSGSGLVEDARLAPYLTARERAALTASFPRNSTNIRTLAHALAATKLLHEAGVPVLAGTDAPNPGTAHGASIHRELALLVEAGLPAVAALASATSVPARVFNLADRGRIAAGLRADLVLVQGDPTTDIIATRDIVGVWKLGQRVNRRTAPAATSTDAEAVATGTISTFDSGETAASFGSGWQTSTDSLMGGTSTASMRVIEGGAVGTSHALELTGTLVPGAAAAWAGAMFFPGPAPMAPANLSKFSELAFWARGDGGEHHVMAFAARLGNMPAVRRFTPGPEWQEFVFPFDSFQGIDGSDLRAILFSAGTRPGPFRFEIDEVRLR